MVPKFLKKFQNLTLLDFANLFWNFCKSDFMLILIFYSGNWHKRKREGPGLICGSSLEAKGIKEIWGKYKGGFLNGPGKATLFEGDCTLQGNFVNGKLHGPVRGLTSKGILKQLC